ncbi:MAG TPA: class I SAM-dependent methyltransferase [Candidatus Baltobacteraceae bacterium]|jgi:SAM-dependent methyltransferase|nr:class I SAM-dependent methyltransferase [Candidatus Baltobacteraceae bacterium]
MSDRNKKPKRRVSPSVPVFFPDWLLLRELTRDVTWALERFARGTLLDVGCGERPYSRCRSQVTQWIGLDADTNSSADITGSADAVPLPDGSVDTILCTQVLEHVPDAEGAFAELYRVLRPGGMLILTVPQYWPLHEEPYDFRRYTEIGLRRVATETGFTVVAMRAQGRGVVVSGQAFNNAILCTGEHLPFSGQMWFKATKAPAYLAVNLITVALSAMLRTPRDVLNHLIVARKP